MPTKLLSPASTQLFHLATVGGHARRRAETAAEIGPAQKSGSLGMVAL